MTLVDDGGGVAAFVAGEHFRDYRGSRSVRIFWVIFTILRWFYLLSGGVFLFIRQFDLSTVMLCVKFFCDLLKKFQGSEPISY